MILKKRSNVFFNHEKEETVDYRMIAAPLCDVSFSGIEEGGSIESEEKLIKEKRCKDN